MKKIKKNLFLLIILGGLSLPNLKAQTVEFEGKNFEISNIKATIVTWDSQKVLKLERDLEKLPFDINSVGVTVDEATFAKCKEIDLKKGSVEVKVLARLLPNAPEIARGFIGVAFRINDDNSKFECIYLRPTNGRSSNQIRRNHSVQYFSYPNYKFEELRKEVYKGQYETYADIGLNEWVTIRIEIKENSVELYLNNQDYPSFIVNEILGNSTSGSIGLWVDIGTEGYFKDLKIE